MLKTSTSRLILSNQMKRHMPFFKYFHICAVTLSIKALCFGCAIAVDNKIEFRCPISSMANRLFGQAPGIENEYDSK